MKIIAISRGEKYSPNMSDSDMAILRAVASTLEAMGNTVDMRTESDMTTVDYTAYDRVVTMARDTHALIKLEREADSATQAKFINSITGILTCTNKIAMAIQMQEAGIPQPNFLSDPANDFLSNDEHTSFFPPIGGTEGGFIPIWLKNCDGSATTAADTVFCPTKEAFDAAFADFQQRGVSMWMAQQHLPGDLIKFYGVEGTNFFSWRYASEGTSKFGLEAINGKEHGYAFDPERVKLYADMIAKKLCVPIYGGDAIITPDGDFYFIDFNDFPSFSSCRDEAAKAIAERVHPTPALPTGGGGLKVT